MSGDVLHLREIDQSQVAVGRREGGTPRRAGADRRRAGAGRLLRDHGCVPPDLANAPKIDERLDRLALLDPADRDAIGTISADIRQSLEAVAIPDDLSAAVTAALVALGDGSAWAVRSSATAEDSPTASFAGQQDTYLNVVGPAAVLSHISRCWASLFTERAVTYRLHNGFDNRQARMAVVVQHMVFPQAAGVLFTADPVTSNRRLCSVEASFGLGEALVAGLASPDVYTVRGDDVVAKTIASKRVAIAAAPGGGTHEVAIGAERQEQPALTDAQVVDLARLGRRIEAHFGQPQDIEWCRDHDGFHIVQSRPITTLFPVPPQQDRENHVYVSVGHQQMMTDAMQPLGLSFWQLTAARPMAVAGGRLFVDVAPLLASPTSRTHYVETLGRSDPLIRDALETVLERGDFVATRTDEDPDFTPVFGAPVPIGTDPAIVTGLIGRSEASLATLQRDIRAKSGLALLDFIAGDITELKRVLFDPDGLQVIRTAIDASQWINAQMEAWLGETNAVDTLTQSVPHNVTSEMGLALLDVADAVRPHADVVAFLRQVKGEEFLTALLSLRGGQAAHDAMQAYLDSYGMRCIGEIDITRPRWRERPSTLVPMILSNVTNFESGESRRRFEQGRREAAGEGAGARAPPAGDARRRVQGRRGQGHDRSGPDLHGVPGVPEVPHGQPLLRLQAGLVARG